MRRLIFILALCGLAHAAVYTPTAFRIDGNTTQSPSACETVSSLSVCNGWVLEIDTPTIGAGGTYNMGLGTNNSITAANIIVTVTHNGFQSGLNGGTCGTTTTYTQKLYGTHVLRRPYSTPQTNDDQVNAGTMTTRIALGSDTGPAMIFSGETVTVQIVSSPYTDGSGNTMGTVSAGTSVTNNSTLAYSTARAIFNWSAPGLQLVTGNFNVRGVGFSQYSKYELPIACVVFTVKDTSSHTNTTTVSVPTIDPTQGDATPVIEYIGNMSVSGLTNHEVLTVTFKAYPWIGDSTAVMDSSDGTYSQPTPLYAPITFYLDTTNNYAAAAYVDGSFTMSGTHTSGTFVAGEEVNQQTSNAKAYLIDVTGANGSGPIHLGAIVSGTWSTATGRTITGLTSGAVFTQTTTQTFAGVDTASCAGALSAGQPATACRTIAGAAVKMAAYNNASSTPTHNDSCGTVFLNAGYYNWLGPGSPSATTANCWATIEPAAGVTASQVVLQNEQTNSDLSGTPVHAYNMTLNVTTSPTDIFTSTYLWLDHMSLAANGTAPIYTPTIVYVTQSSFGNNLVNGLCQFSTTNISYAIIRGNNLNNNSGPVCAYTMIGNTNTTASTLEIENASEYGSGPPTDVMPIVAFNTFYAMQVNADPILELDNTATRLGTVVVQNLFENIYSADTQPMMDIQGNNAAVSTTQNTMLWNTTAAGGRINRDYNDGSGGVDTTVAYYPGFSELSNIFDYNAIKSDTFPTGSANRVGNWFGVYSAGSRGNFYLESSYSTDSGQFCNEFWGINTYGTTITAGATQPPDCSTNSYTYIGYHNRQSFIGGGATSGNGDYRLLSSSPAVNLIKSGTNTLPYDLAGQIRNNSGWGSPGAFEQAIGLSGVFSF
jgi:hypothetical protein